MRGRAVLLVAIPAAFVLLTACGQAPDIGAPPASATSVASEPADAPQGDRAPHYDEDHRYRERIPVSASNQRLLDAARTDVLARLAALPDPPTVQAVTAVVATTDPYTPFVGTDGEGVIGFESEVGGAGCLIGTVPAEGEPTVETGGFIKDGGCHALTGH